MQKNISKIKKHLPHLADSPCEYSQPIKDYFKYYGLDFSSAGIQHSFGSFESAPFKLAAHIFTPQNYESTVFLLPGYFDHTGQLNHLIKHLLESNHAIATFDLPGMGLSTGSPGQIDDFSQYSRALTDFIERLTNKLAPPYHFIGHSTGASAAIDALLTNANLTFDKIILAAPLIHCSSWQQTKITCNKKLCFIKKIPRVFRKNSSDPKFLDFIKNSDPLQFKKVPLKWVRALHKWNAKIESLPICDRPINVIQGTDDKIVDWQYNLDFLKTKFRNININLIQNANHELLNEAPDLRKEVFSLITHYLTK